MTWFVCDVQINPDVHVHNVWKRIWDMNCQSKMPVLAIACALKHLQTCFGYFLTYIYSFITRRVISVSSFNTMNIIFILLWLVTYGFYVTYKSVFFTTFLKNEAQEWFAFVSSLLEKHFLGILKKKCLSLKRICKLKWKPDVTNIINVSLKTD